MIDAIYAALEAFIREHEYCDELDTGLDGERVWMTCKAATSRSEKERP
jgi:hypothetical protein